ADSVALLDLLHTLTPELGLSLVVAHVDHGIRSDSGTVARAVGELAERYELPFEVGELSLGPDATETVARRARYAWLGEVQRRHAEPRAATPAQLGAHRAPGAGRRARGGARGPRRAARRASGRARAARLGRRARPPARSRTAHRAAPHRSCPGGAGPL